MAASGKILGKNAKAYYNTATFGSPTWVEIDRISKLKWELTWGRAENATRGSTVMRGGKTTGQAPITFTLEQDLTDTPFLAVWAAVISPTAVFDMMILNGGSTVNGVRGIRGEFDLTVTDEQDIGGILVYDIKGEPSATVNALQTVVVAASAPAFTTLAAT